VPESGCSVTVTVPLTVDPLVGELSQIPAQAKPVVIKLKKIRKKAVEMGTFTRYRVDMNPPLAVPLARNNALTHANRRTL
jgi:hypothetical protein